METALSELINISNTFGKDRSLVQGVGGNTSSKTPDGKSMYVKASGTALKDMASDRGWRKLDIEKVQPIFSDKSLSKLSVEAREQEMVKRLQAACNDGLTSDARPSVESPLHVLLDDYVIHLHALVVLSYASAKGGKDRTFELFQNEPLPPLWVPYADPGYSLGKKASVLVWKYRKQHGRNPQILILEKHGLFVAAQHPDKAMRLVRKVIRRCQEGLASSTQHNVPEIKELEVEPTKQKISEALSEVGGQVTPVHYCLDQTVLSVLGREDVRRLLSAPPLTPDEMGFVNSPVLWLTNSDYKTIVRRITSSIAKNQRLPAAFLVKEVGLFIAGDDKMAEILKEIVVGSLFVRRNAQDMGGINGLNRRQREFISNWEAEEFRIQLSTQ